MISVLHDVSRDEELDVFDRGAGSRVHADAVSNNRRARADCSAAASKCFRNSSALPAACRAQSCRDFITKMKRLEEEADESELWLALLRPTGLPRSVEPECRALENECHQVVAIAVQSVKTARLSGPLICNRQPAFVNAATSSRSC